MAREKFDEQLVQMTQGLMDMRHCLEKMLSLTVTCLRANDRVIARQVIEYGGSLDEIEKQLESLCLKMILKQQPIASDLRRISTVLKMITDLKRMGDHIVSVAEIVLKAKQAILAKHLAYIEDLSKTVDKMLIECLQAYVEQSMEKATSIIVYDDIVDTLFEKVKQDTIVCLSDRSNSEALIDTLMIAKYFERMGDRLVDVAEWVIFSVTGEHRQVNLFQ